MNTRQQSSLAICAIPWVHQQISERGRVFPCAFFTESGSPLTDTNGRPLSLDEGDTLTTAWNSPLQRSLRLDMLAGKRPSGCARCFRLEAHGLPSLREVANRSWGDLLTALPALTEADGSCTVAARSIDIRFGNLCNLRCRMCSPESSVKLLREFSELHPEIGADYYSGLEDLAWFRPAPIRSALLAHAEKMEELHFAGGEPFLIPELASFLEELALSPRARSLTLSFNTNLTVLPDSITRLWPKFGKVKVIVSLDGKGALNNYIRFPSRFEVIERNLRKLDNDFDALGRPLVCFNVTVQAYNVLALPELVEYLIEEFRHFLPFPILSPLHWPAELSVEALPKRERNASASALLALPPAHGARWREVESRCDYDQGAARFEKNVRGLANRLVEAPEPSAEMTARFRATTSFFDRSRGQSLPEVVPGLRPLFGF